jgi:prophage regulatory protein
MARSPRPRPELTDSGYLRLAQLAPSLVPVSPTTLWRMVASGKFPRPVRLSARVTAWRVEDVRQWLDAQGAK